MGRKFRYLSFILSLAILISVFGTQVSYGTSVAYDADGSAWYYESVRFALNDGLLLNSNGYFHTSSYITRAEVAYALYTVYKSNINNIAETYPLSACKNYTKTENPFTDVFDSSYYTTAIKWVYGTGIMEELENGKFGPNEYVTREQAAKYFAIAMNYSESFSDKLNYPADSVKLDALKSRFSDYSEFSDWSYDYIYYTVYELNAMRGYDDETFRPQRNITRAEFATMLYNYLG